MTDIVAMKQAKYRNDRYRSDPEYRLLMINRSRKYRGLPPISDLSEMDRDRRRIPISQDPNHVR